MAITVGPETVTEVVLSQNGSDLFALVVKEYTISRDGEVVDANQHSTDVWASLTPGHRIIVQQAFDRCIEAAS